MGGAMLTGWLAGGFDPAAFTVIDPYCSAVPAGVHLLATPPAEPILADVVLLGFKPQQLPAAAAAIRPLIGPATIVLSILAGIDHASLCATFPAAATIVRVMPNLAAALGKSPIALFGNAAAAARGTIDALMAPLGQAEWLTDESLMDAVTALAGSGPAFVYRFVDALAAGGAALGLPRDQADRLALAMVEGAAALAAQSPHSPADLARRVASPGGTTEAGLAVLDADRRLAALIEDTLRAARDRSVAMGQEARERGSP
jgi:pyrroline-5-carboxylate reductase